jgi:hypothetical protein
VTYLNSYLSLFSKNIKSNICLLF